MAALKLRRWKFAEVGKLLQTFDVRMRFFVAKGKYFFITWPFSTQLSLVSLESSWSNVVSLMSKLCSQLKPFRSYSQKCIHQNAFSRGWVSFPKI